MRTRFFWTVAALTIASGAGWAAEARRPATVLLVTDRLLAEAWGPFADWKTRIGKSTKVLTVQAIAAKYPGRDRQAKIRAACLAHIGKDGTRWVILGGDSLPGGKGLVPDRDTPHRMAGKDYKDIPTDAYYVSPGDWDKDADGIHGEWEADRASVAYTHPKASVGRIPVRTAADVRAYTDKVVAYESAYPADGFASRMLYTCPEPHALPKLLRSWDDGIAKAWPAGGVDRFFMDCLPWHRDKAKRKAYALSPDHWVEVLNRKRYGKIHMHGHGFLPGWVLAKRKMATVRTVREKLKNDGAYPVMTTVSCFTGQFDAEKDPSIVEAMLRAPSAGAVCIVAPAREGVPVFHDPRDMRLMLTEGKLDGTTQTVTRFWAEGLGKGLTTGEALAAAKALLAEDARRTAGYHWVACEMNLLGDPTLDLRAGDPKAPACKVPDAVRAGDATVAVRTDPGMTVCLWQPGRYYATKKADAGGAATFSAKGLARGALRVGIHGSGCNAVTREIAVR